MSVSLNLTTSTNVALTPQLQKAIKLLQLSSIELQQEISTALETNPFLEIEYEDPSFDNEDYSEEYKEEYDRDNFDEFSQSGDLSAIDNLREPKDKDDTIGTDELPVELNWDDTYQDFSSREHNFEDEDTTYERNNHEETLQEILLWNLRIDAKCTEDYFIGEAIIDAIDLDGYMREPLKSIYEAHRENFPHLTMAQVEATLKLIQQIAPKTGIGARDLKECLQLQLNELPSSTEFLKQAKHLVDKYLENLAMNDNSLLMKRLKLNQEELEAVKALIRSLNPKPGLDYGATNLDYIIPDLIVKLKNRNKRNTKNRNGKASESEDLAWEISLNSEVTPKLKINNFYASMAKSQGNSEAGNYLKENHREAKWLIDSIENRKATLLKVGIEIVKRQQEFLSKGAEYMKPMVLADIAEAISMHESTVSRATNSKYMSTPLGTFELKFFFSSHVSTNTGDISATAIRAKLKKLIDNENKRKPLSDNKLVEELAKDGIPIARRTVAKYRESMNIASSSERKAFR